MFQKGSGLKPRRFAVGNFVVLNDGPSNTVEGSRQLNFPGSKELYKIVEIHKEGFSLALLNMRTQARLTVVHSRVTHLNIDEILNYDIGMPQLYEKLVEMNVKRRNTFIPGKTNQPLKLLTEEDLADREDFTDGEDMFDGEDTTGFGGEDTRPDFEEIEVREDDQNDKTENIIVNDNIRPRYNLRN